MDRQVDYIELVEKAQKGDKQSLNTLAAIARERLRVYVYRLTLQEDLSQEIVQESLLEMCRVLGKLKKTDRFWSWLYGIATNKLHRHYRTERTLRNAASSEARRRVPAREREGGLENLVSQELRQIVSNAMKKLRTRHKAVLVMRCYDGMSYAEIAESMGCTEFGTRMLFVRAKRSLQKELSRNGFGKGSLLAALIVFGKMTAPSEAAAAQLTVSAAAVNVGVAAGVVGLATSKTAVLSVAAAGALTVGTVVATSQPGANTPAELDRPTIANSFDAAGERETFMYYLPDGPDGSVILRATSGSEVLLQNDQANYSYRGGTISINNHRMWGDDLRVMRLPTDSPQLREFLAEVEGAASDMGTIEARGRGLLLGAERNASAEGNEPWGIRQYNALDEDYFKSDWPANAQIVDNRDVMHQRGWTYFRVRGQVAGQAVTGRGRIPFIYDMAREHRAWLELELADGRTIADSGAVAFVRDAEGQVLSSRPRGSFFEGLSRPWMGLHTVDTVRRDAAERRVPFETRVLPAGHLVAVTTRSDNVQLAYTIDLEADLVLKIAFLIDDTPVGDLEFEYLQDVEGRQAEFRPPTTRSYAGSPDRNLGILWLVRLAQGTL
jgi:RNA polymerase sigma-70 factor (ECF subfamily)